MFYTEGYQRRRETPKDKDAVLKCSPAERLRKIASYQETEMEDVKDLIKEAKLEAQLEATIGIVIELWKLNIPIENIAIATKLTVKQVEVIIENHKNKA